MLYKMRFYVYLKKKITVATHKYMPALFLHVINAAMNDDTTLWLVKILYVDFLLCRRRLLIACDKLRILLKPRA